MTVGEGAVSFSCIYYCDVAGDGGLSREEKVAIGRMVKVAMGFEFVVVDEVVGYSSRGAKRYSLSALLHAADDASARRLFSYGLGVIDDIIRRAGGLSHVSVKIGKVTNTSGWSPSFFHK